MLCMTRAHYVLAVGCSASFRALLSVDLSLGMVQSVYEHRKLAKNH
jgi:hypothetical protein